MDIRYYGGGIDIFGDEEPNFILTDSITNIVDSEAGENESIAYMGLLSVLIT